MSTIERNKDRLNEEINALIKEKDIIEEAHSRTVQELNTARSEIDRLESSNINLNKDVKEKFNHISQLGKFSNKMQFLKKKVWVLKVLVKLLFS